jgi:hypothetical protein
MPMHMFMWLMMDVVNGNNGGGSDELIMVIESDDGVCFDLVVVGGHHAEW